MKQLLKDRYVDVLQITICLLALLMFSAAQAAETRIWQCNEVELTDKVTLRSKGGDKRFITGDGAEISKVDAIKKLINEKK